MVEGGRRPRWPPSTCVGGVDAAVGPPSIELRPSIHPAGRADVAAATATGGRTGRQSRLVVSRRRDFGTPSGRHVRG